MIGFPASGFPDDRRGRAPAARPGRDLQRAELIRTDGLRRPRTARATRLRSFSSARTRSRAGSRPARPTPPASASTHCGRHRPIARRSSRSGSAARSQVERGRIGRPGKAVRGEQPGRSVDARARGRGSCDGGHESADDHRRGAGIRRAPKKTGVQAAFSPSCSHQSASARRRRGRTTATRFAEYAICA